MAATNSNTDEVLSQSLMKIQSTNYQVDPKVSAYPEELKMLIVALKRSPLSTAMFSSFSVPMIPNNPPFVKPVNSQIIHMFNEMGHQPELEKISDFRKSGLPCIWNFLFGIFLRCLTGRSVGLDRGRVEVYAMPGKYKFGEGDFCARYWSLILEKVYEKEAIPVMTDVEVAEFSFYQFPKTVEDDEAIFSRVARIPDAMLRKVSPTHKVLVRYLRNIDTADQTGVLPDVATPSKKKKKELLPSKSGVLKQIRKAEVSSKGVTIRSIPAPVSPARKDNGLKMLQNMQRTLVKRRKMVIRNESSDEEVVPETPPVTSMVNVSLPMIHTSQISTTIPQTKPLEIVLTKSVSEEVPISDTVVNVSDTGAPILSVAPTIQTSLPISLPVTTLSNTSSIFEHALQNPFTTLFPSQSPENPQPSQQLSDTEVEGGAFGGILDDIPFDSNEEDIPDHMLMTGKQFKILNQKLKTIIKTQVDSGRMSSISAMEVDVMLKGAKKRIMEKIDQSDKNNELRLESQGSNFTSAVQDLKAATKERHILFVQDVKKVREDVNFKIQELSLNLRRIFRMFIRNKQMFKSKLWRFLLNFQSLLFLKLIKPQQRRKQAIQKALAPLTNFTSLLPKSAPHVYTGVQGGEKSRSKEEKTKTVGKVISTQLVATIPIPMKPISSTTITTKTVSKGIVIGENEGGSSSKSQKDVVGRGKGILYEKSKEELKADAEAEMERMRQVQSIMRQRASDPPSMNKGDPVKLYSYETIESKVVCREMYEFEKKPKRSYDIANSDHCQLDFPINEMLFINAQYKTVRNLIILMIVLI
ncbi:unnamed protein product [Lactuca saligna]|uniref:Uncharacterized protein n=1 Tax=Lactuca saligna TaxID=75948 RepID=A0AA36A344_LACSI|nr:unnamed protein product [Lactuca saligna]